MFKKIFNNLEKRGIEVDTLQSKLIKEMVETVNQKNNGLNKLKTAKSLKRSFYIWGNVGRGKTLITRSFIDLISEKMLYFITLIL